MSTQNISDARRIIDIVQAFSIKKESSYGTALADNDISYLVEAEGVGQFQPRPIKYSNQELIGRGHEFLTKSEVLGWEGEGIQRVYPCNPLTDGLLWALALGNYSASEVDTGVYLHTSKLADLAATGLVPTSTTLIEKVRPDWDYKIPGVFPVRIEAVFNRRDMPKLTAQLKSSGELLAVGGGYTYPSPSTLHYYKPVNVDFQLGPMGGSFIDVNQVINEVTVTLEINIDDNASKYPGGSQQDSTKGQVDDIQLVISRVLTVSVQMYLVSDYWRNMICDNTPMALKIDCLSDDEISAGHKYMTRYQFNCLDPGEVTPAQIGDLQGVTVPFTAAVFSTATIASMFSVEVRNDIAEYLIAGT